MALIKLKAKEAKQGEKPGIQVFNHRGEPLVTIRYDIFSRIFFSETQSVSVPEMKEVMTVAENFELFYDSLEKTN